MKNLMTTQVKRFNYLMNEIDTAYHEAALKLGLSDSASMILYTICNLGGSCLLSDIYGLSGISRQTLNSALRKLEKDGIVSLAASDGKKKTVSFTDKGRELAQRTAVRLIGIENEIFAAWPKEEQDLYLSLTQKYLDAFRAKISKI